MNDKTNMNEPILRGNDILNGNNDGKYDEKEIEKMAKVIEGVKLYGNDNYGRQLSKDSMKELATTLYNADYRNCKDKVVLDKEEYEKLKTYETLQKVRDDMGLDYSHGREEGYTKARKETARKILNKLFPDSKFFNDNDVLVIWQLKDMVKELAKQYGVEIKE